MTRPWRPILSGELAASAAAALIAIDEDLSCSQNFTDISLADGAAGRALYHAYRVGPQEAAEDANVNEAVGRILDGTVMGGCSPSFLGGYAGVLWVFRLLERQGVLQAADALHDDILHFLAQQVVARRVQAGMFDLADGLVGIGLYALDCMPRDSARNTLESVLRGLEATRQGGPEGAYWLPPGAYCTAATRDVHVDLGVAHGLAGVVAFLARVIAKGYGTASTVRLLRSAVAWLQRHRAVDGRFSCFEPHVYVVRVGDAEGSGIAEYEQEEPGGRRTAWCYGDLGAAVALLSAGRALCDKKLAGAAVLMLRAASRRTPQDAMLVDGSMCHGAAGIAHICNRVGQFMEDDLLVLSARRWFEYLLSTRRDGRGVGGFTRIARDGKGFVERADPGFLTGSAGIGLGLAAALCDALPWWDGCLLLV